MGIYSTPVNDFRGKLLMKGFTEHCGKAEEESFLHGAVNGNLGQSMLQVQEPMVGQHHRDWERPGK